MFLGITLYIYMYTIPASQLWFLWQGIGDWPGSYRWANCLIFANCQGLVVRIKVTIPGQILRVGELLLLFIQIHPQIWGILNKAWTYNHTPRRQNVLTSSHGTCWKYQADRLMHVSRAVSANRRRSRGEYESLWTIVVRHDSHWNSMFILTIIIWNSLS